MEAEEILTPVVDTAGFCKLELAKKNEQGIWLQYNVPCTVQTAAGEGESNHTASVLFCDYASAGNTLDKRSRFNVWMPQLIDAAADKLY